MRQTSSKEYLIKLKLRKEDPVELPMDDQFFEKMHNKIMQAIDSAEIKPQSKWNKTRVFLEQRTPGFGAVSKKISKSGIISWVASVGLAVIGMSSQGYQLIEQLRISRF
jgi:hypothetical protein